MVTRPYSKLKLACARSAAMGGALGTFDAVAERLGIAKTTLYAWFGPGVDPDGSYPDRHLPSIVRYFREDGVNIELAWFYLDLDGFTTRVENARPVPAHDIVPTPSTDDWRVSDPAHLSQGIAALFIHPPPPSNDPNTFQLRVSLSLARYPDEIDDIALLIGLRQAAIVPEFTGCQPAEWHPHDSLRQNANTLTVLGPREGRVLDGTVMEQHTLATLEYTTGALPVVDLQLRSRRVDLEVVPEDPTAVSINRQKVLQRFLAECDIAAEDRQVTWSRARMVRRSSDEADA
jgi:hypothetical protein